MKRTDDPSRFRDFRRNFGIYYQLIKHMLTLQFQRKTELQNPQEVLCKKFGDNLEVLNVSTDKLVNFGDNYSSIIVKAVIDIKNEGETTRLNLVAKMLPASEFIRKYMKCEDMMAKEIFLYEEIIPAYQKLCGNDFDIVPKFYGGRLTTQPGVVNIDDGALLLLENLKESEYVMEERFKGLTMDHMKIAVPAIAKFHALGIAMKQKNPVFFSKIHDFTKTQVMPVEVVSFIVAKMLKVIKNKRDLRSYYERVKSLGKCDSNGNHVLLQEIDPENPYACLTHRDLWINNMMFLKDDGKINNFKLFDFQIYGISSPMSDLLYFLFTSLPRDFNDFDETVKLYRESMCSALKKLDHDWSLFNEINFEKRLKEDAKKEIYRCLLMARTIEVNSKFDMMRVSPNAVQRMKKILEIYESKGWLDD